VSEPSPTVVRERHADALTFQRPGVDEHPELELVDEVGSGLTGDQQPASDLTWMQVVDIMEQAHHLVLSVRDAELDERLGEALA
jgi:hypothetical protein